MSNNPFGGKNPTSLYVPMSETEQELLSRLIEANDLEVVVHGWGVVHKPRVSFGDLRVAVTFRLDFDRPEVPIGVSFFDLELRTMSGLSLFRERQPSVYNGQPVQVGAGTYLDMVWDIAIHHMDPKVVKTILPKTTGLTTRRLDKETGEATFEGNMRLTPEQRKLLVKTRKSEKAHH